MAHIFISYSRQDTDYARPLRDHLEALGFDVWMDEKRLQPGERWWARIQRNIDTAAALVVVMSPQSEASTWVEREILYAERRRKPIFPVLVEGDPIPLLANLQYADLTGSSGGELRPLPPDLIEGLRAARTAVRPAPPMPADSSAAPAGRTRKRRSSAVWLVGAILLLGAGGLWVRSAMIDDPAQSTPTPPDIIPSPTPTLTETPLPVTATDTATPTDISPSPTPTAGTPSPPTLIPPESANAAWKPVTDTRGGLPVVYVPAGCFVMGSGTGDRDETPLHRVCLSAYWIGQTEITNTQYRACVEAGACPLPQDTSRYDQPIYANHPVVYITWDNAAAYAAWVGGSLPTEAQWEFAARGPEGWLYPWGNESPTCDRANIFGPVETCQRDTALVGVDQRPAGASWVGALDMNGNVWEWATDWYGDYPSESQTDPPGPLTGQFRIIRGGSWHSAEYDSRATFRNRYEPGQVDDDRGLRVVFPADSPAIVCAHTLPPQVTIGQIAIVTDEDPRPVNIRQAPGISAEVIGKAQPGELLQIIAGPVCQDGYWWWEVQQFPDGGQQGWSAEGDSEIYFFVPGRT